MHFLRQLIWVLTHNANRVFAILLVDARRHVHRDLMRLQEEVQLFDLALLRPGADNLLAILRADPLHLAQAFRLLLDDRQGLLAKVLDDQFGFFGANAFDQTRAKIALNPFLRGWQALRKTGDVQLTAIAWIVLPLPLNGEQLPNLNTRQRANNCGQIITKEPPAIVQAEAHHGLMIIFIAKDNAFDGPFKCEHSYLFLNRYNKLAKTIPIYSSIPVNPASRGLLAVTFWQ